MANKWKTKAKHTRRPKSSGSKRKFNAADAASVTCYSTQTPSGSGDFQVNKLYSKYDFQLRDFERAVNVASAYQYYRMSGITLKFKSNIDTFLGGGGAGGYQKTYLYYMIDKGGNIPTNITLEGLKRMGAKPIALDEKAVTVKFKPAVLTGESTDPTTILASQYKVSPWLNTTNKTSAPGMWSPSEVDHRGIVFYVEQQGGGAAFKVDVEVNFDFKKPLWGMNISDAPPESFSNAASDSSPDGIVGTTT